jgi:hypothetical protein
MSSVIIYPIHLRSGEKGTEYFAENDYAPVPSRLRSVRHNKTTVIGGRKIVCNRYFIGQIET